MQSFRSNIDDMNSALEDRRREKARLQKDLSFVGALSLAVTLVHQFASSAIIAVLMMFGVISAEKLQDPTFGLGNTGYMILTIAVYVFQLLLPALAVALCFKKKYFPLSPAKPVSFGVGYFGIIGGIGFCMSANIVNSYILAFFDSLGFTIPEPPQTVAQTPTSLALNLFAMAVLPALLEEMIWRGYILRSLRPYGNAFAVVVSSVLFSVMHGNLRQIPFAFIVGLALGYLYVATNNIWISVAVHFANNAISVLMEYFSFSISDSFDGVFATLIIYGFSLIGVVSMIVLFAGFGKQLKIKSADTSLNAFQRIGCTLTNPLFLTACFLYAMLLVMEIVL